MLEVPPQAIRRANGDAAKAKVALVKMFEDHPHTRGGLNAFGMKIDRVFIVKDSSPTLSILFVATKDTQHPSSDASGFFGGVWKSLCDSLT